MPSRITLTTVYITAGARWCTVLSFNFCKSIAVSSVSSGEVKCGEEHIDELDADERHDDASKAVHEYVCAQDRVGAFRTICDAAQRQWNERHDDECVEDHGRQDRT